MRLASHLKVALDKKIYIVHLSLTACASAVSLLAQKSITVLLHFEAEILPKKIMDKDNFKPMQLFYLVNKYFPTTYH